MLIDILVLFACFAIVVLAGCFTGCRHRTTSEQKFFIGSRSQLAKSLQASQVILKEHYKP